LKETQTGDVLLDAERDVQIDSIRFPEPVMSFAVSPKSKGDEEKMASALRRLNEEDPTLTIRRDVQTGETLLSGMSQVHVEVAVERLRGRFGVEVELRQPRVPYLEPIMELEATVPDDTLGAVNGGLNSRRGRLHGMDAASGMTTIRAEVPLAELLTYSQSLTSLTGGRGDYHMQFLRYEEVPSHIAQKLIDAAKKDNEAVPA